MTSADARLRVAVVLGAILALPVLRAYLDGGIPVTTAAVRTALALGLAYGGVVLVATVVGSYLPGPPPDAALEAARGPDGVEDAFLVDERADRDDGSDGSGS